MNDRFEGHFEPPAAGAPIQSVQPNRHDAGQHDAGAAPTSPPLVTGQPQFVPQGTGDPQGGRSRGGVVKTLFVLSGVAVVALVGVAAYVVLSQGGAAADPAPATTTAPVAEQPVTTEVVAAAQTAELTNDQKRAVQAARDRLATRAMSRDGLIEFLVHESDEFFFQEDAEIAVDSLGIDWTFQAKRSAEDSMLYSARSKNGMMLTLIARMFTEEQATEAVESLDVDWSIQPERYARERADSISTSRKHLVERMTEEEDPGFTEPEAEQGITDADIDFKVEAAEAAEEYLKEDPDLTCDELTDLLVGEWGDGFSLEEANYGTETSGTC